MDNEMLITRLASSLQKYPRKGAILILKQRKDISRLSHIINELEKELKDRIKKVPDSIAEVEEDESILYFLQELKGSDKE